MRIFRSLCALVILLVGLAGVPVALVAVARDVWPRVGGGGLLATLTRPDDGSVLVGLVMILAWAAWAVFAGSVLVELVNLAGRGRFQIKLPGLAGPQHLVGGLLLAVVTVAAAPVLPATSAAPTLPPDAPPPVPTAATTVDREQVAPLSAPAGRREPPGVVHVVARGDDLWSLAERYYGEGRDWRRIAAANPDELAGGPDRLQIGARLAIPGPKLAAANGHVVDQVVVRPGDTLSVLAERLCGDAGQWPQLYAANRPLLSDPDEIDVGQVLRVPAAMRPSSAKNHPARPPVTSSDAESGDAPATKGLKPGGGLRRPAPHPPPPIADGSPGVRGPGASAPPPAPASPTASSPGSVGPATGKPPVPPGQQPSNAAEAAATAVPVLAGIGGLLAAGLVGGLLLRRRAQLATRPIGRRILHPPPPAQSFEAGLGRRQTPATRDDLDLVLRAVALHIHQQGGTLPGLLAARVSAERIELVLTALHPDPPVGFSVGGSTWSVEVLDLDYLARLEGVDHAPRAYPALATVGVDAEGRQILVDFEQAGVLGCAGATDEQLAAIVAAVASELTLAPWADELAVTLVGADPDLAAAADRHNLRVADDPDGLIERLARRAAIQRRHLSGGSARQLRLDPELAEPWTPEVVMVAGGLTSEQAQRLRQLADQLPRSTLAVFLAMPADDVDVGLVFQPGASEGDWQADLRPLGWRVEVARLDAVACSHVTDLLTATGSEATTEAPWWPTDHPKRAAAADGNPELSCDATADDVAANVTANVTADDVAANVTADDTTADDTTADDVAANVTADDVTSLTPAPRRAWADEEDPAVARLTMAPAVSVHHPTVLLLGPIGLVGAAGLEPVRAVRQCVEYCAWLLEHPGASAPAMAAALAVAEGTRRSNVSRLRSWLGEDDRGEPYLPDAYSGRIVLNPTVSSDWQRFQVLTAPGINRTSTEGLQVALDLVRGAPLADAAPGQWHWAEELRTDIASAVRDLGVELTNRALADRDLDLARWAAARALVAAPEDEQLLSVRIRTEHLAGNGAEVERLSRRMTGQARLLGVDLDPDTVILLQQVLEGRVRARSG